jgi:hypothetical protein
VYKSIRHRLIQWSLARFNSGSIQKALYDAAGSSQILLFQRIVYVVRTIRDVDLDTTAGDSPAQNNCYLAALDDVLTILNRLVTT